MHLYIFIFICNELFLSVNWKHQYVSEHGRIYWLFKMILTPENIIRPILYKNVMYTEYSSQIYPPFCCFLYVCWHRTLVATSRQVCISPVNSTSCSPLSIRERMFLPRVFVQGNIFWRKNVWRSISFYDDLLVYKSMILCGTL